MNIHLLTLYALQELKDTYDDNEIRSICRLIYTDVFNYTNINIHLHKHEYLDKSFSEKFNDIIALLKNGEPIQHIIGECNFCDLKFKVNKNTLIPRPETEELVHWINETIDSPCNILDIGTGSGCIAVSLAHSHPLCSVDAIDISSDALEVAAINAVNNNVKVNFMKRDIQKHSLYPWQQYNIIVSNPPYVMESERKQMHRRVIDHEPELALFVPDNDPLLFYRIIAEFGKQTLSPGGTLFFEINEALGNEMVELMAVSGYKDIILKKDLFEKDRFIRGRI